MRFIRELSCGIELRVKVLPRSSKSELAGEHDSRLKIRLNSPPVDGQANKELIKLLSNTFGIAKSDVSITRGRTSRLKTLVLQNLDTGRAVTTIEKHLAG